MTMEQLVHLERLVKSAERIRDLGEVFTPAITVAAMLDLLPDEIWNPHNSQTFLEPACGDGNFLVAILDRKLDRVFEAWSESEHLMDSGPKVFHSYALQALASIYAVDVSVENIVGGTPGHEVGARERLIDVFQHWNKRATGKMFTDSESVYLSAKWIVDRNLIVGNMLAIDSDGKSTGRDLMSLLEYKWTEDSERVKISLTSLGDVMSAAEADIDDAQTLFGTPDPVEIWSGKAMNLFEAPIALQRIKKLKIPHSNGRRVL